MLEFMWNVICVLKSLGGYNMCMRAWFSVCLHVFWYFALWLPVVQREVSLTAVAAVGTLGLVLPSCTLRVQVTPEVTLEV